MDYEKQTRENLEGIAKYLALIAIADKVTVGVIERASKLLAEVEDAINGLEEKDRPVADGYKAGLADMERELANLLSVVRRFRGQQ